jgi:hypothetical protein
VMSMPFNTRERQHADTFGLFDSLWKLVSGQIFPTHRRVLFFLLYHQQLFAAAMRRKQTGLFTGLLEIFLGIYQQSWSYGSVRQMA